ncbi:MAG: hypothetical protein H6707_08895 [Deltaproteobacteria bacterium]|nr:hypothetical protein [Deltaproteobacteria bacterium]
MRSAKILISLLLLVVLPAGTGWAAPGSDAPGDSESESSADAPGLARRFAPAKASHFVAEIAFGLSSLLDDPDVKQGIAGDLRIAWFPGAASFGLEASAAVAKNDYSGSLGQAGTTFIAGNISFGPTMRWIGAGGGYQLSTSFTLGGYLVVPPVQEWSWSLGVAFGGACAVRVVSWLWVGVRLRYHLFNLTSLSGPALLDIKGFQKVGVIDRLEIPFYVSLQF